MARKVVKLNRVPQSLDVTLATGDFVNVELYAKSTKFKNTAYSLRWNRFKGLKTFRIMLPIPIDEVEIVAREKGTGNESVVGIKKIERKHLETHYRYLWNKSPYLKEFLNHIYDFCERSTNLPTGQYNSNSGNIKIKYEENLYNTIGGKEVLSTTPCRIDANSKEIEVAKSKFQRYSVSGRIALLLHEFSHCYINRNKCDEFEADKNCALIYLGLGFPRVDLLNTWIMCYENADNEGNRQRLEKFFQYVDSIC